MKLSSYVRMRRVIFHWEFFVLDLAIKVSVWSMQGGWTIYYHLRLPIEHGTYTQVYLWNPRNLSCIVKKLQNYKLVKLRQAVLQGTDSRWIRPWSTCEKKWNRQRSFSQVSRTAWGHRGKDAGYSYHRQSKRVFIGKNFQKSQEKGTHSYFKPLLSREK